MNLLLATYNFFPSHKGGSEHYVLNQAKYLSERGFYCEIICSIVSDVNFGGETVFEDSNAKFIKYRYDSFWVTGIFLKGKLNKEDIYKKSNKNFGKSLNKYFSKFDLVYDQLELHGFSSAIGLNLISTLKNINPEIFIRYYNHVALSCPKGTYIRLNEECNIIPSVKNCLNCMQTSFNDNKIDRMLSRFPYLPSFLPSSFLRKKLVKFSLASFRTLSSNVNEQIVFSYDMHHKIQKINNLYDIRMVRHGIPSYLLESHNINQKVLNQKYFGFLGRLLEIKGFAILAKAWLKKEIVSEEKLIIAGDIPYEDKLCKDLLNLLLERKDVQHLGYISGSELISFLSKIHVLVVPSQCVETGPLVIHEAISHECNIIGSNVGGVKELCKLYNQTTFVFNDVDDLHNKILTHTLRPLIFGEIIDNKSHFDKIFE